MNPENLRKLVQRYRNRPCEDADNPINRQGMWDPLQLRVNQTTLLNAPFSENLNNLDIALVGVPFDLGVTQRPGARYGPKAVRQQFDGIGPLNHQTKVNPFTLCRVADIGDVDLQVFDLDTGHKKIEEFYARLRSASVTPITVGGDHSITYPILKTLGVDDPVGLIHIDAHCDTMGAIDGTKFHHGGPFLHAVLDGVLDPTRTIQIGIRGAAEVFWEFSYESGMTVVHMEDFEDLGMKRVIEMAKEVVGDGPTYISFDIDGLDPAFAPGTGTPEVGGLTPREAISLLRGLRGLNIIGGDVVEIAPDYDPTYVTAQVAKQMLFEILCLTAESFAKQNQKEHLLQKSENV
jgi:agmatinase